MTKRVTISVALSIDAPESDEALAVVLANMLSGLPDGSPSSHVKVTIEGASSEFAASFQTGFQLGKARIAARKGRTNK